jgi:pimeloyl-ACP methyl ester carboxylesterase
MFKLVRSSTISVKKLWPEIMQVNFLEDPGSFLMPVYFIQGIYDFNSPTELVRDYFNYITAPDKDFFLFENSAHAPNYEESYRFNRLVEYLITNVEHVMDENGKYLVFEREYKVQYED